MNVRSRLLILAGLLAAFVAGFESKSLMLHTSSSPSPPTPAATRTTSATIATKPTAPEPDNFHGVKWGASEREARKNLFEQLDPNDRRFFDSSWSCLNASFGRTCRYDYDFGGDVEAFSHLQFVKDELRAVTFAWSQKQWPFIRDTFTLRFGKPSESGQDILTNAMGATFTSHWLVWRWSDSSMLIREYGLQIDECGGMLSTKRYESAMTELQRRNAAEAAGRF